MKAILIRRPLCTARSFLYGGNDGDIIKAVRKTPAGDYIAVIMRQGYSEEPGYVHRVIMIHESGGCSAVAGLDEIRTEMWPGGMFMGTKENAAGAYISFVQDEYTEHKGQTEDFIFSFCPSTFMIPLLSSYAMLKAKE